MLMMLYNTYAARQEHLMHYRFIMHADACCCITCISQLVSKVLYLHA